MLDCRYRTQFTMGYWAEPLLGFWIAVLVLVGSPPLISWDE